MAQLDKVALYAEVDLKFPIAPLVKVKSADANSLCKTLIDSAFNVIDDAAALSGNIGEFSDFETIMNAGLNAINS